MTMNKFKSYILNKKNIKSFIFSLIVVLTLYIVVFKISLFTFMTNDDANIQNVLSGNVTGTPYFYHQLISVFLSFPIAFLYKIFPGFSWWFFFEQFFVFIGIFLINLFMMELILQNNINRFSSIFFIICFNIIYFLKCISKVNFTFISSIFLSGIISFFFYHFNELKKGDLLKLFFMTLFTSFIAIIYRFHSGLVGMCYLLLMNLYLLLKNKVNYKLILKYVICLILGLATISILVFKIDNKVSEQINGSEFVELNEARITYMDYRNFSYEGNEGIYSEIGWSENDYNLVENWFFLDNDYNLENLQTLLNKLDFKTDTSYIDKFLLMKNRDFFAISFVLFLSFIIGLNKIIKFKNKKSTKILFLLNNLGTIFLLLALIYMGRVIYRALIPILLPATTINLLCYLSIGKTDNNNSAVSKIYRIIIIILFGLTTMYSFENDFMKDNDYYVLSKKNEQMLMNYVTKNINNIYMLDVYTNSNVNPLLTYNNNNKPYNMFYWGGTTFKSNIYYTQLKTNGLDKFDIETFAKDNVYLISPYNLLDKNFLIENGNRLIYFYKWALENSPLEGISLVDTISDNMFVYKLVYENNISKFNSYYVIKENEVILIKK